METFWNVLRVVRVVFACGLALSCLAGVIFAIREDVRKHGPRWKQWTRALRAWLAVRPRFF